MTGTRRRRLLAAGSLAVLAAIMAVGLAPALAQEAGPPTFIRAINANDPENVQLQLMYGGDDIASAQVVSDGTELETGEPTEYLATPDTDPIGLVVVVDTSTGMDDSGSLGAARDGLAEMVSQLAPGQEVAILAASDDVVLISDFSTNTERLQGALDTLAPSVEGGTAIWAGVTRAGELLAARDDLQPNIMVISSGASNGVGTEAGAVGQAISSGSSVFVLGAQTEAGGFQALVTDADGSLNGYASAGDLSAGVVTTNEWLTADQFVIPFAANRATGVVPVTVNVGEASVEGAYVPGRFTQGAQGVAPEAGGGGGLTIPFLDGALGKYIGIAFALVAISAFVYAIFLLFGGGNEGLTQTLQPYAESFDGDEDDDDDSLAKSALIQRPVSVTEQVADSQGYLSRTEAALERASLPLRAGEALFFYVVGVVVVTVLALFVMGSLLGGLLVGGLIALIPPATVNFLASRRRNAFLQMLPDTLQLLAGTLRAGYSLMQGVEAVSQEVSEPMGHELRRVVTESRLGRPLEESLDGIAERMASPDFAWAVMAIRIQREVGGNLSELLLTVAETMTQRERLRRDIKSLTAEGRISALVLGFLPLGLMAAMYAINPEYISTLFTTGLGNVLLILAIVGMLVGFAWMRQIIKIEI